MKRIAMNTNDQENILGTSEQGIDEVGDVPFVDKSIAVTTGNEIIAFSTVESPVVETVPVPLDLPVSALTLLEEGREHNIHDVLSREYFFEDFTIPAGGVSGEVLKNWNPLLILLSQENFADKVAGFAYLRATLVIRLEFTTLPTVTGGVVLSYFPDVPASDVSDRLAAGILQKTQVPNVQQSLTTAKSMKIKVPWISPFYGRDLVNNNGANGTIVFSRLTPSSTATVNVRAYVSCVKDDIHLQYPTVEDPIVRHRRLRDRYTRIRAELETLGDVPEVPVLHSNKQTSNFRSNKSVPEERNIQKQGKISGLLNTASRVATIASGIPVVGTVASAVAPLLNIGSSLAAAFGFAKPALDVPIQPIKYKPNDSHLTNEGALALHRFGIQEGQGVDSSYGPFGSDVDEMSIAAIMQTTNALLAFPISTTYLPRQVLFQTSLNLCQFYDPNIPSNSLIPTHQFWISQLFRQWNATLNFDFDLYLTHFHRVKLRFLVLPNVYLPDYTGSVLPASIDINKASSAVVEFTGDNINYSLQVEPRSTTTMKETPTPYLAGVTGAQVSTLLANRNTLATSYGTLLCIVEVPLEAATTTSPLVYGVVSFSAENVELTNPTTNLSFLPAVVDTGLFDVDESEVVEEEEIPILHAQSTLGTDYMKLSRSERMTRGADLLSSNSVPIDSKMNIKLVAGDACIHLRNILNAYTKFSGRNFNLAPTRLLTFYAMIRRGYGGLPTGQQVDLVDYLMSGYAFYKGSMNMRFAITNNNGPINGIVGDMLIWNRQYADISTAGGRVVHGVYLSSADAYLNFGVRTIPMVVEEGVVDVNVPYYQTKHIAGNSTNYVASYIEAQANVVGIRSHQHPISIAAYRAAGDDFRCGFLWSLPRFVGNPTKAVTGTLI